MKRSKRPPRGNGNHLAPAGHQHPLFSCLGSYWYRGRPCRIIELHPHRDGRVRQKARPGEHFTILNHRGRRELVPRALVGKQPHSPRRKAPFTKRRRLGT